MAMHNQDIRWEQRFSNYRKALGKLEEAVTKIKSDFGISEDWTIEKDKFLDDIIKEGLIQRFEYTHELAWNVLKDFLENAGNTNLFGSKDATREAFASGLINNGEVWMDMIKSRNKTSHTYNEATADEIFRKIIEEYLDEFLQLNEKMESLKNERNKG
jgi:nucleotidyltransferase substrate binding protein (TIGR01987 family)